MERPRYGGMTEAMAPRSRKGAETRARLLEAAKRVFEEKGFLDARISDISERAGLSHGSFYHYFDSKEQIFREIAEAARANARRSPPAAAARVTGSGPEFAARAHPPGEPPLSRAATATRRGSWA